MLSGTAAVFCGYGRDFYLADAGGRETLIQSMTVMGVSMGALIGVPQSLAEIYGTDIKQMYQANGIPLYFGLLSLAASAFVHLMIMSGIMPWRRRLSLARAQ